MMHRVVVTDGVALSGLHPLTGAPGFEVVEVIDSASAEFADAMREAAALIVRSATTVSAPIIEAAPALRAIGRAGVGVDNVDIPAATARGIAVYNAPGGNTTAAAELTMALLLAAARMVPEAHHSMMQGKWDRGSFTGVQLKGKTLGLIGAGRIGGEVASRSLAFGMTVLIYDPYLTAERADALGARLADLNEILETADFVSIHVPLTEETRGIVGREALAALKSSAFVINASRGGVLDEEALADALRSGDIAGAALDVYEEEPLPDDSPLRGAPNLVLTPHLGASTIEAQIDVATEVAEKIRHQLDSGDTSAAINAADLL